MTEIVDNVAYETFQILYWRKPNTPIIFGVIQMFSKKWIPLFLHLTLEQLFNCVIIHYQWYFFSSHQVWYLSIIHIYKVYETMVSSAVEFKMAPNLAIISVICFLSSIKVKTLIISVNISYYFILKWHIVTNLYCVKKISWTVFSLIRNHNWMILFSFM